MYLNVTPGNKNCDLQATFRQEVNSETFLHSEAYEDATQSHHGAIAIGRIMLIVVP